LLNVLENSRKYAASGGAIAVHGSQQNGQYRLEVSDRGAGIPETEREQVFERFARGTLARDGSVPGVGLGLYLARAILRAHGGELCAAEPGAQGGARFVFTVPLVPGEEESR
jgi:K+-sensing histidine kinase KdpD